MNLQECEIAPNLNRTEQSTLADDYRDESAWECPVKQFVMTMPADVVSPSRSPTSPINNRKKSN